MVNISSQLVSLLKDLQNTQASAVLALTDETGLPNGVTSGDELKAMVVGKLSDLYLLQVNNRLIRARTQLPLQMGDALRLRVVDTNTPATVRILEHLTQQPQPSAGSEARTFMSLKSALVNVASQIKSLLENVANKGSASSNLPEGIQFTITALNTLAQGNKAEPNKIQALFSMFSFVAPNTAAPDTVSTPTIFIQMLREGLDVLQKQLPSMETPSAASGMMQPQGGVAPETSQSATRASAAAMMVQPQDSPHSPQMQGSQPSAESGDMQTQLVLAGNTQSVEETALSSTVVDGKSVTAGLRTVQQPAVQEGGAPPINTAFSGSVSSGPALTQATAEQAGAGAGVRPVWLYEAATPMGRDGVQQAASVRNMPENVPFSLQNQQINTFQEVSASAVSHQPVLQPLSQVAVQTQGQVHVSVHAHQEIVVSPGAPQSPVQTPVQAAIQTRGQVQGQVQASETPGTPNTSFPVMPVTAETKIQAADSQTVPVQADRNIQASTVRQAMGVFMNQTGGTAETESPALTDVQQSDSFKDMQIVQPEIYGQARTQLKAVPSNTLRAMPQDEMAGLRFEQASATIADEQTLGMAQQTTAHGQETDVRAALHTMNALVQHMDRMQTFRLELQQQTGINFWLVPIWFDGENGSGHMIWWQDQEDGGEGENRRESQGYNLLFDLRLSRLGNLKIRLSCLGETVQFSVAAERDVLPVIRSGIEELRTRLHGAGFSMKLVELSALSESNAKAFDPLGGGVTSASGVLNIVA
ncbi:MAG: hypothetical protein ABWK15_05265 [Dissulfuribacterales bacterium]